MSDKTDALRLYLEGLGFRAIGRFLGVSNVAVLKWIKKWGATAEMLHKEVRKERGLTGEEHCEIERVELDEMWSYLKKNSAHAGYGLLWIPTQKRFLIGKQETDQK